MNAPAAIRGTFSDFKIVRGRKVAMIVIEVPIEEADAALVALGGVPVSASERWVAVARLNPEMARRPALPPQDTTKDRRPLGSLPYAQQAALKCNDPDFGRFLKVRTESEAAEKVRKYCGIGSRREIEHDEEAKTRWLDLLRQYDEWRGPH